MTDGIDDPTEKGTLQRLQQQIETELAQRCGTPTAPIVFADPKADRDTLEKGAEVYAYRCQQCHGVNGDGQGPVAQYLDPSPRDYTKGIFKFTSTPYGSKPRHSDLVRTLRAGIRGTAMPAFDDLDPTDLAAVSDYVIFLAQRGELQQQLVSIAKDDEALPPEAIQGAVDAIANRWKEAQSQTVMPLTPMPAMTTETIAKGHELFLQQVCNKCHGVDGRGGLAGGIDIGVDSWGHKGAAADLTSGMYRGGGRPIDIYRRIYSGINGTPMPGFSQAFAKDPDSIWYLVHYVRDLGERRRRNQPPPKDVGVPPSASNAAGSGLIPAGALPSEAGKADEPSPPGITLPGETPEVPTPKRPPVKPADKAAPAADKEKKSEPERKPTADEKKAADDEKAGSEDKSAKDEKKEEKPAAEEKKAGGEEKPATKEKEAGTEEKPKSEEKPADGEKKAGAEEEPAGEQKPAAEEKPKSEEKPAGEEKPAADGKN